MDSVHEKSGFFIAADQVVVEIRRFPGEQVLLLTRLEAREVGYVEKHTFFPDRLVQCFASGLKEIPVE
jgi:hypothetical protein